MSAIAGIVGLPYNPNTIQSMEETMSRRGPDGKGVFQSQQCLLLQSKLSHNNIKGIAQPITILSGGKHYTMVYNGAIYNLNEIKEELETLGHILLENSEPEIILHAYIQWKENCLHKINGVFGIAIWEQENKRLFLARDRLGVKPLFYAVHNEGFVFSTEIKTIFSTSYVSPQIDAQGAAQIILIGPGRIPGSGVFHGIKELEPGCFCIFENNKVYINRYWKMCDREHKENFEETAEHIRWLVTDSIERRIVLGVPFGTFLSGGLDSSITSAVCAQKLRTSVETFSLDYKNNAENFVPGKFQPETDNRYIEIMQEHLQTVSHWTVLSTEDLISSLEDATIARDLPGMGDVDFSLLAFCKDISKYVKIAMSGECADELFGGYPWYRDPAVRSVDGFPWAQNTQLRNSFLPDWVKRQYSAEEFIDCEYKKALGRCDILPDISAQEKRMREMVNLNTYWFMQTLLDRNDRMSSYYGLEVRVPFCDYRIAEYMYSVPWEYKDHNGREKGLLRYAMRQFLPDTVLYRKKSPYPKTWDPSYRVIVQQRLEQLLRQKSAPVFEIVDKNAVLQLLTAEYTWPWYGQLMQVPQTMAYILQIDYWLRHYNIDIIP